MPRDEETREDRREERPRPSLRVKLAVVASSLLVGLLVFEIFLRAIGFTYPVFYEPDASRGYALKAGMQGWYRKEGVAFVKINSEGLRDREHAKEKPPGTLRVAVVGDSYAEAFQVSQEQAFWAVMERRLQACPPLGGRRVEVINFGVSGYGTAQELITLRERVWEYSPDVVLLAVTTNNDVLDNSRALKLTDEIPYFTLREGRLVLDDSFRDARSFKLRGSALNRTGRWIRDRLRFVQAIHLAQVAIKSRLDAWRDRRRAAEEKRKAAGARPNYPDRRPHALAIALQQPGAPTDELGAANVIYREPSDDTWRDAWAVTEKLVATMSAEVKEHGARFLLVTLSNGIQVDPDASARRAFADRLGVGDLFYPERRFRALGEREGFPVLNLAPELQRLADERKLFLHGFGRERGNGHWNEDGHRIAGELLAENLCGLLARAGDAETPREDGLREGGRP
ncbi:MAG TPA: SGNH/GDSL hydrolase family protein [Pyrinomonadaceae bacterium]|nr:SGNH/GDSL hydrolase family protein [Pyrinomonadaceae bacterium]